MRDDDIVGVMDVRTVELFCIVLYRRLKHVDVGSMELFCIVLYRMTEPGVCWCHGSVLY